MSKMTDFATWLLKELEARDLTQTDLADYLGVSRQTVNYYIMKGDKKRPNDKVLYKIAKIRFTCGQLEVVIYSGIVGYTTSSGF